MRYCQISIKLLELIASVYIDTLLIVFHIPWRLHLEINGGPQGCCWYNVYLQFHVFFYGDPHFLKIASTFMCWPSCTNYKFVSIFKGTVLKSNYPMPCNSLEMTPFLLHLPRSYAQLSGNLFTFQMPIHQTSQMHFVCNPCPFCLAIPSQCDIPVPRHEHTHVSISPLWQSLWSLVQVTLCSATTAIHFC